MVFVSICDYFYSGPCVRAWRRRAVEVPPRLIASAPAPENRSLTRFERFESFARMIVSVPKEEADKETSRSPFENAKAGQKNAEDVRPIPCWSRMARGPVGPIGQASFRESQFWFN
jgi:hypothetical protein